jgi:hypothetical protein
MTRWIAVVGLVALTGVGAAAQPKRPEAMVTASTLTPSVAPGGEARLVLAVTLPANVHVQSNKPSDPFFIPTVLTVEPPAGFTVEDVIYPKSEQLKQEGLAEPLIVFGNRFTIEVRLKAAASAAAGSRVVPGRLRYQACDATTCYPPARAEASWTLQVGAAR